MASWNELSKGADCGNKFEIVGWQTSAEVRDWLMRCDVFVLPSLAEGLPVSIMEAYAANLPVISTYIAGIPELVDANSGWVIPAGDENALADAMESSIRCTDEARLAKANIGFTSQ